MREQVFYLCIFALVLNLGYCSEDTNNGVFTRVKRQVYNYFYGSGGDYQQGGDDYYVNECGYLSSNSYQDSQYPGAYEQENFIDYNSFPVAEKSIPITAAEVAEVKDLAQQLLDTKCNKENVLKELGIGTIDPNCTTYLCIVVASNPTNLLEIIHYILCNRYNVNRFDVVKFPTINPLPPDVCTLPYSKGFTISELDRILLPHCVLDDSKLLNRLPSPRSLSLFLEQYNKYKEYGSTSCLNSFGFFLFQAFSHDVQQLVTKAACGDNCLKFTGCNKDGKIALVDTLRTDSVDVLDICSADPFYGFYGKSCITAQKLQNLNSDCEIRKRAPLNTVTQFIDLNHIYQYATIGEGGSCGTGPLGSLPYTTDPRAYQTTPLLVVHILKILSHNELATIIKDGFNFLSDEQVYELAKQINIYIFQIVLYQYLLPTLLGPDATNQYNINSTENCYDVANKVKVDVETIVVALRYCHAYIPEEYQLLTSNYEFFDKKSLDDKLSSDALDQFFEHVLRGLFATKVQKDKSQCCSSNNYAQKSQGYKDDLRALDIQAARDACVEPCLQYLANFNGVSAKEDWRTYESFFRGDSLKASSYLYKIPQELELAVCGALQNHHQSVFGDLFKTFISNLFSNLKCSDPNFWSNTLSGDAKDFLINFDVQDWIACVAGLEKRPTDIFCPLSAKNPLVPVTCKSKEDLINAVTNFFNP